MLEVMRQGAQGSNPARPSFQRRILLGFGLVWFGFVFWWFITSELKNNGREMKHAVVFFPQPPTRSSAGELFRGAPHLCPILPDARRMQCCLHVTKSIPHRKRVSRIVL